MRVYLLILLAGLSSCRKRDDQGAMTEESVRPEAIVGTWESEPVQEGRREKFIVMTFTDDGRVTDYSVAFTDSVSGRISGTTPIEGTYTTAEGAIHWNIDGSVAEIPYRIEGGTMRQTLGKEEHTFKRKAAHDEVGKGSPATP